MLFFKLEKVTQITWNSTLTEVLENVAEGTTI